MQNFSSLASTQMNLDTFFTIFEENFWIIQANFLANSKKTKLYLAKHVHANFQLSSFYPDGLRHIFDHFKENIGIFQENS
jgi:arginine deiminase